MQISLNIQKDRSYSHQVLEDIECGKDELFTQEQYDKEMEVFEKSLLCEL